MSNDGVTIFDVEPTKVTEFSLLFEGHVDFAGKNRLLLDGNKTYECGLLRHVTERPAAGSHGVLVESDVMDEANEKVLAHVTVRVDAAQSRNAAADATDGVETITGMACTCTRRSAPQCVHACAVCFLLFYRHRYAQPRAGRDGRDGHAMIPREASGIVERYMADQLGSRLPVDAEDLAAMARGLEIITGFDRWKRWIGNDHAVVLLGNCMPTVEQRIDMQTRIWPRTDAPGLDAALPHGWFTMLEAAYEKLGDRESLAKVYAVYIAQGRLPQDARYVDRLRWLLGDTVELTHMIGQMTGSFRPPKDERMRPVASLAYEHLLREFSLSDEAVAYCESLRKRDRRCARRLADVIAINHADRAKDLETVRIDWDERFDDDDVDYLVGMFRADLEDRMPAFFANGYVDPIVEDCEDLIRSAAAGVSVRCRLLAFRRFPKGKLATIARDLLRHAEELLDPESDLRIVLQRAIAMVELRAEQLARTFLVDDDVVVFTPPLDEATLQREHPRDFMEALRLIDDIDGLPLAHDADHGFKQDLATVEQALRARIEQAKTESRFQDIAAAGDDDYDPQAERDLQGLRECLAVQLNALFGQRYALDSVPCDDLFDPPVTAGQRNKLLRPTAGQLGVWAANYVLNVKRHEHAELGESVHLAHFLAAKGLRTAMIAMLDHMLGVTAMLDIPRAQVDLDEWNALHLLRIDPHPEFADAHGNPATLRPDRDFTVKYMTDVLCHVRPDMQPIDAFDKPSVRDAADRLRMLLTMVANDPDSDAAEAARQEADDAALAIVLAALANPDVPSLIEAPEAARTAAEQAKQAYMTFWHARDENDATPANDDDSAAGHEADITDAGNMMLVLLEQAYTRFMDIAEPGYKDW